MAKKKYTPDVQPEEDDTLNLNDVVDTEIMEEPEVTSDGQVQPVGEVVESAAKALIDPAEPKHAVHLALPRTVLFALLDYTHSEADVERAKALGLISGSLVTPVGKLILDGLDQTTVRHKMLAGYRAAHNAAIDREAGIKSL